MSNVTEIQPKEAATITIDDVVYEWDKLPADVKNIVSELQYCESRERELRVEVQRNAAMQRGYTAALGEAMKQVTA